MNDFETSFGGWTQSKDDTFDWLRGIGDDVAHSASTGPTRDHTLGTSAGSYAYIEASRPRQAGDNAQLISIPFRKTQTKKRAVNGCAVSGCVVRVY